MALPSVPAGFQYTTLTEPGGGWDSESIPYGQSPAVVTGDTLMTPLLTSEGHSVVAGADGIVIVDTGGSSARQLLIGVDIYRVAADAFMGAANFAINDQAPSADPLGSPVVLRQDMAMTPLSLADQFSDFEGDTVSYTVTAGSAPTGTSVNGAGLWSGTPTAESSGSFVITGADPYGASGTLTVEWTIIDLVTVPEVRHQDPTSAEEELIEAFLAPDTSLQAFSLTVAAGLICDQSPLPDEIVEPGTTVVLTVSRGLPLGQRLLLFGGG